MTVLKQILVRSGPLDALLVGWRHRTLVLRLARREIEGRYRGSWLGIVWSVLTPLAMLAVYTFVFGVVFRARWDIGADTQGSFALVLFSGMIVFNVFAECVNRAPTLMIENAPYIKKVVFPLEVLPLVVLLGALFHAAVGSLVLLVAYVLVLGPPPATALLFPVVALPMVLVTLGFAWFLSSLGLFLRDLRQMVGVFTTVVMFFSPLFYPVSALPEAVRPYLYLNPLTVVLDEVRLTLFAGQLPDWRAFAAAVLAGWLVSWLGYVWFVASRRGFADVV